VIRGDLVVVGLTGGIGHCERILHPMIVRLFTSFRCYQFPVS
jgi:hypothetical protein